MLPSVPDGRVYIRHWEASFYEGVPLVEFMYLVFTRMLGESYCRRVMSLLCLCDVFRALTPLCLTVRPSRLTIPL